MTRRIVLIEDDPDTATLVEEMLRDIGHRVNTWAHLEDGAGDDQAELVITDLVPLRTFELTIAREWIARVRFRASTALIPGLSGLGGGEESRERGQPQQQQPAKPRCRGLAGVAQRAAGLCE